MPTNKKICCLTTEITVTEIMEVVCMDAIKAACIHLSRLHRRQVTNPIILFYFTATQKAENLILYKITFNTRNQEKV